MQTRLSVTEAAVVPLEVQVAKLRQRGEEGPATYHKRTVDLM